MDPAIRERLEAFYEQKKLRRTNQRELIIGEIFSSNDHFTAEEMVDRIKFKYRQSSRATVYRTLSLLVEAGLLKEIDLGDEIKHYDPNFHDQPGHAHLICIDCGKVVEFADENLKVVEDCLVRRMGFRPTSSSLRVEACCDELRRTGRCASLLEARLSGKRIQTRRK